MTDPQTSKSDPLEPLEHHALPPPTLEYAGKPAANNPGCLVLAILFACAVAVPYAIAFIFYVDRQNIPAIGILAGSPILTVLLAVRFRSRLNATSALLITLISLLIFLLMLGVCSLNPFQLG